MSCYFDSYFLSGKQTGVLGRQPRRGPWNRASGNLPRPCNRGDKSLIFWDLFWVFWFSFFCYFEEEMGTFHVGVACSQKNCCSPGVVERKRCRWARFWSGSAPADRDVWLSRPGHPCCPPGLDRRESESFTSRTAFRKQRNSPRTKMLFLSSYQHSGDLHRAGVKVLREGKQKQVTNADAPGFHEVAARKKKRSHEIPLCSTRI